MLIPHAGVVGARKALHSMPVGSTELVTLESVEHEAACTLFSAVGQVLGASCASDVVIRGIESLEGLMVFLCLDPDLAAAEAAPPNVTVSRLLLGCW